MILRMWRAQSTVEKADEYVRHATTKVFPALRAIDLRAAWWCTCRPRSLFFRPSVKWRWRSVPCPANTPL